MRKNILYIAIAAVATTFLAACSDDDYNYINPSGNPVVTAEQPPPYASPCRTPPQRPVSLRYH